MEKERRAWNVETHTKKLLEECNSGCKMGINSMKQVSDYIKDDKLKDLVNEYIRKHQDLEKETSRLLQQSGEEEKDPGPVAAAFSKVTTEVKLMIKDDSSQIAKLLTDGSNMGIQSISKAVNQYCHASTDSIALAKRLVKAEERFMKDLQPFL